MGKFDPYIPRVRGRLPWRYELEDGWTTQAKLRLLAAFLIAGAIFWGLLYWVLK